MPRNKRESFIYSVIMCFTMVLWMSMYNVTLHMGHLSLETIREGWIGFPFAFVYAFLFDWFIVSGPAKGIAFRYFVSPESSTLRKVITISCCMVVPMVFVLIWRSGSLREIRRMEPAAHHLADQYSEEHHHGASVPAHRSRSAGAPRVPYRIPGGNRAAGTGYVGR